MSAGYSPGVADGLEQGLALRMVTFRLLVPAVFWSTPPRRWSVRAIPWWSLRVL